MADIAVCDECGDAHWADRPHGCNKEPAMTKQAERTPYCPNCGGSCLDQWHGGAKQADTDAPKMLHNEKGQVCGWERPIPVNRLKI